ncbi:hypothetical protein [Methanosphaera stadtmanae]|nr:hypothetical protein [Methanosphaera stadtmanae]MEE0488925.1 hypothetical protein [Methanosphaera stadtmanae]
MMISIIHCTNVLYEVVGNEIIIYIHGVSSEKHYQLLKITNMYRTR